MKMISSYERFVENFEEPKPEKKNKGGGVKGSVPSINYNEYVAEQIDNQFLGYGTSGSQGMKGSSGTMGNSKYEWVGKSRISDKNLYTDRNEGKVFEDGQLVQSDNQYNWYIRNGNLVAELKPHQSGTFTNGQWFNGQWPTNNTVQQKPHDGFGDWTKDNSKRPLHTFEKWMIGIGISSLIIGIVTVLVMVMI